MFKIGEFSKITQVSIRMLRYYDEQKLLIPQAVDRDTGYRMYAAEQIEELNKIIFLRNTGFGVNDIKEMLHNWNSQNIKQNFADQIAKSRASIENEKLKIKQLEGLLTDIDNHSNEISIDITLKSLPMVQVISMRKKVDNYYCEGEMWKEFEPYFLEVKNPEKLQSFSIYHDIDYREHDVDIEICVVDDGNNISCGNNVICRQIPKVDIAACFIVQGDYSNISKAYKQFAFWLEQHEEYEMSGENRQVCHVSMCQTDNPKNYITELQIPLKIIFPKLS